MSKIELKVVRDTYTAKSTIGRLYLNGEKFCETLEDPVRPNGVKIYGQTAIWEGKYEVEITFSNRFQTDMPLIFNSPEKKVIAEEGYEEFSGVRIHKGNTAENTHGCILVGESRAKDFIGHSRKAYERLMKVLVGATEISLEIENRV